MCDDCDAVGIVVKKCVNTQKFIVKYSFYNEKNVLRCSIVRTNAIKLARKGSGGSGSSTGKTVTYRYNASTKIFTMDGFENIIGGDFVINGTTLKNIFLVDPINFEEVPSGASDLRN